jgi:hypothetical protein
MESSNGWPGNFLTDVSDQYFWGETAVLKGDFDIEDVVSIKSIEKFPNTQTSFTF